MQIRNHLATSNARILVMLLVGDFLLLIRQHLIHFGEVFTRLGANLGCNACCLGRCLLQHLVDLHVIDCIDLRHGEGQHKRQEAYARGPKQFADECDSVQPRHPLEDAGVLVVAEGEHVRGAKAGIRGVRGFLGRSHHVFLSNKVVRRLHCRPFLEQINQHAVDQPRDQVEQCNVADDSERGVAHPSDQGKPKGAHGDQCGCLLRILPQHEGSTFSLR
mmetsp:Transcript_47387/g.117336  ORF Transcript_47387/g.117336 Transcript_47387/m.117336 type:complete len:218 (+) Transcript_47387:335-988(+)